MKLNLLFVINTVLAGLFGLGLIFAPAFITGLYGVELAPAGLVISQMLGSCLVGIAILSWLGRGFTDFAVRQNLAMIFFLGYLINLVISFIAQINGVLNALAWVNVAGYGLLALGFGYFILTKKN